MLQSRLREWSSISFIFEESFIIFNERTENNPMNEEGKANIRQSDNPYLANALCKKWIWNIGINLVQ